MNNMQEEIMHDIFKNNWIYNENTGHVSKRINFGNNYTVSIIRGAGTNSNSYTCEVAVSSINTGPLLGNPKENGRQLIQESIEGYVTRERLHEIIEETKSLPHKKDDKAVGGLL